MIGYCAGQSVKVQQMVGVDQAGDVADSHLCAEKTGHDQKTGGHPGDREDPEAAGAVPWEGTCFQIGILAACLQTLKYSMFLL